MIGIIDRAIRDFWALGYRIPELASWTLLIAGMVSLILFWNGNVLSLLLLAAPILGVGGIVRWRLAKRRCRFSLVIPLFQEGGGADGRGREAQDLIVDDLRRHLPERLRDFIQPLSIELGPTKDDAAAKLLKRLGALYVLHGRVTASVDTWSVFPRVLEPARRSVIHKDLHTRDSTPANPSFGPFVTSLTPTVGVRDEEFPLEFCRDLEAVILGIIGVALVGLRQYEAAIEPLEQALAIAGNSSNHQIDSLRVARAECLVNNGREDEAIVFLRVRARTEDPSSHLLRSLANFLIERSWGQSEGAGDSDRVEALELLRRTLLDVNDPQRSMSVYNLAMLLPQASEESRELQGELLARRSGYRRLWYVKRLVAMGAYAGVEEARESGNLDLARKQGKISAKWYSKTLRARPWIQFLGVSVRPPFVRLKTFPRSPILYANTKDGHSAALHRYRTRYFEWRFQRIRSRILNLGDKHLRAGEWDKAYAYFDWASCVGRGDGIEYRARAYAACCCWKGLRKADGEAKWEEAASQSPDCLLGRFAMVNQLTQLGLDPSVPGSEPTELEEIFTFIEEHFPEWVWHTDGEFIRQDQLATWSDSSEQ